MTFFIAVLLHFYDLKYLNLTKSRLSNQKSGIVLKNDEVRGGVGEETSLQREISWLRNNVE